MIEYVDVCMNMCVVVCVGCKYQQVGHSTVGRSDVGVAEAARVGEEVAAGAEDAILLALDRLRSVLRVTQCCPPVPTAASHTRVAGTPGLLWW